MTRRTSTAFDVLRAALARVAPDRVDEFDEIDLDVDIWREFDLDSLDHLTVMDEISQATGIDIAERDYPRLISLGQLCAHVEHATR